MTTYTINNELNGIEILFDTKPEITILETLKNNGFRWHKVKRLWYAKNTESRLKVAESIATNTLYNVENANVVENSKLPSLWERCKIDNIPKHNKYEHTKTIAAETRKHIKERFPEIKFSCRIGSGRWASANEVNFYFQSAPFSKDSDYFKAIEKYVKAWLWSFNYDNSDSMTDYFDRGFYETISTWDYEETEPTEEQKADMENFDTELLKAKEAEQKAFLEECERKRQEEEELEKKISRTRKNNRYPNCRNK